MTTTDDANFRPGPRAEVIRDSVSPRGDRLTTIEATMHRFVLAELNTHRVFSRNSASSRAIPFSKQVDRVMTEPAIPVSWPMEQRGMQGGDEIDEPLYAEEVWLDARIAAVRHAQHLADLGVHKSVVNRMLEPFMWHTVIITATEWDGFWEQRCSPLAQPEIRVAAEAMKAAYDASTPLELRYDDWHLPYIDPDTVSQAWERHEGDPEFCEADLKRISAARCARVSYLTHDGKRDIQADLDLFDRLASARPMHASPFEHVATPCFKTPPPHDHLGNFRGWDQFRHFVEEAQA